MNWINELKDEAREPDTLAKIIDSMRGVIELAESFGDEPTTQQISYLTDDIENIHCRLVLMNLKQISENDAEPK